ncbi:asparaginase [Vaginella massiliensis]|uniref:asparaginase n=1 Tax=Vaginella massiliensis TaxID=1816680 RepID=UPI003753615E
MRPKILIIYTGGTIGMAMDYHSQSLIPFDFDNLLKRLPEISLIDCDFDYFSFEEPIDSSNMRPEIWLQIAEALETKYHEFDGFVILHGTDTMSYTASALSFMTENLEKPIIFTGSQLPIGELRTDAKENLITSILLASLQKEGKPMIQEVCIYFEYKLFRANRTTKINAENFDAFESPNFPSIGISGVHLDVKEKILFNYQKTGDFRINKQLDSSVGVLKIFPGIPQTFVENLLHSPNIKAFIIEAYGTGNIFTDQWFIDLLQQKAKEGIHLIINTQCAGGMVEIGRYSTSTPLAKIGVISSFDLTMEAAITKAIYLLGQNLTHAEFKTQYETSLKGEMSTT